MTDKLQALCFGAFLLAYYYFVLRKYNTLGFRMFSVFFFIGTSVCYWWYADDIDLKSVQHTGMATQALVLKKLANSLEFRFNDQSGKSVVRTQTGGISVEEFASVTEGRSAPILYSPHSDTVYLTSSYERQLQDNIYILIFPGILYLIGIVCWITLRKYRVHAYGNGSIFEFVTDESGKVVLDDAKNSTTKAFRTYSTMSKVFDIFNR